MTLTISLPSKAETLLTERARAAGQDVKQYVEQLIARELDRRYCWRRPPNRLRGPSMPLA